MDNKNQVSVSYIGDLAHTPPDDVLLVERDEDYVQACQMLSHGGSSSIDLKLWVRSKNHFAWLRDFTEQIGYPSLFKEKTARSVLVEQWNVWVPDWLTDAKVLENNLLSQNVDSEKQTSFEDRLLAHLLGTAFRSDKLHVGNLVDVIKSLVSDNAKAAFKQYPVLYRCLEAKCSQWAESSSELWMKELCGKIPGYFDEVWHGLSLWSGLHVYPEKLLEYVLSPEQVSFVRKISPKAVTNLPFEPKAREQMLAQIEIFFKDIIHQVKSSGEFQKVLGYTSGRFLQEYNFISSVLKSEQFSPAGEDVKKVQDKFISCPGVAASQLSSLEYCVRPDRPTLLNQGEEWSCEEWKQWVVEKYLPYRSWQVHNNQFDKEVEQTVARFSEWYIDKYVSIHKDPDLSLTHCLRSLASVDSENEFSIILLLDCLPVTYMPLLESELSNVGFSRHELGYRFALLPTSTEYNKPALFSGEWDNDERNYEKILNKRITAEWIGKKGIYLSNLKAMSEMTVPHEPTIAVLNLVDGDKLLHSDVESQNTTYEEELHRLFLRLAESLHRVADGWPGPKDRVSVYVVTDHGACRLLEEERCSFDSTVVNKLFTDEKHRFAPIEKNQVADIPENLFDLGYKFKRPFVSDDKTYFLPRGHNTVRQTSRVKGFLHGGVTPEEVIVPTAIYKLIKTAWKTPVARFPNLDLVRETGRAKFYIQRVVTLQVDIQNPNTVDIRILRASVTSPETDLKSCEVAVVIPAGGANILQMSCYFKKSALEEKSLAIEIAYEVSGEQHTLPFSLECEFKSAMAGGFNLKNL